MAESKTQFEKEIQKKLNLLDEIFDKMNVPKILENPFFDIDKFSTNFYLKFELRNSIKNNIPVEIILSLDGISLNIHNVNEIFEWNNSQIIEENSNIVQFFIEIFTSYILLEYCDEYKVISLFDKKGSLLNRYNISTSLLSFIPKFTRQNSQQQLFFPIC